MRFRLIPILLMLVIVAFVAVVITNYHQQKLSATPLPLSRVKYWAYQIQKLDEPGAVENLARSHYDMLVLEPTRTDKDVNIASFDTKTMVAKLKNSKAHDGLHRKLVIAYLDIGEAESWRWYWTWSEEWPKGHPRPADWPDYILAHDPDGWADNYPVAFWDPRWKDTVIYGKIPRSRGPDYKSMLDEVIKDDFDGIYLDWVEAFENEEVVRLAQKQGRDPAEEMITFIREMKTYAKARNSHFLIIQQNAPALALDGRDTILFQLIDAIAQEDIWYDGIADAPWHDPRGYDLPVDGELTQTLLEELSKFKKAKVPIFNVEYALNFADDAYKKSTEQGFIPYVTRKSLEQLTSTPPPMLPQSQTLQRFEKRSNSAMHVTFYGFADNDPPGDIIAYPQTEYLMTRHNKASGTGTYDDPLTMASDPLAWPIGIRMYIPYLKKYVIMEDSCASCIADWQKKRQYHIDVWMQSNEGFKEQLLECENDWTQENTVVEVNPPPNRPVVLTPLFDSASAKCLPR